MQGYLVAKNAEESRQVGLIEYLAVSGQDVRPWVQPDAPAGADPGRGLRPQPGRARPPDRAQGLAGQEVQRDGQDQDGCHNSPEVRGELNEFSASRGPTFMSRTNPNKKLI